MTNSNLATRYAVSQDNPRDDITIIEKDGYYLSNVKALCRRGVMWLGQTCNLRCYFCYFVDKIASAEHSEHRFMSLEKAKEICTGLVERYGNTAIDIQGGEPSIAPYILDLIRHCRAIGLKPSLITNGLIYDNVERCRQIKDAGVLDLLVSVHGIGETYDGIVKVKGASRRQQAALVNLQAVGVPFRMNVTLCREVLPQLPDLARLAIERGARAVNFIAFNPFIDQNARREADIIPRYGEQVRLLLPIIDELSAHGIEVNIRYMPFCVFPEAYRKHVQNFQQIIYDLHEWETEGEMWSGALDNRHADKGCPPFVDIDRRLENLRRQMAEQYPDGDAAVDAIATVAGLGDTEKKYKEFRIYQTRFMHPYRKGDACRACSISGLCDGFHKDYADNIGFAEATAVTLDQPSADPRFYQRHQLKVIEAEEAEWVFAGIDLAAHGTKC